MDSDSTERDALIETAKKQITDLQNTIEQLKKLKIRAQTTEYQQKEFSRPDPTERAFGEDMAQRTWNSSSVDGMYTPSVRRRKIDAAALRNALWTQMTSDDLPLSRDQVDVLDENGIANHVASTIIESIQEIASKNPSDAVKQGLADFLAELQKTRKLSGPKQGGMIETLINYLVVAITMSDHPNGTIDTTSALMNMMGVHHDQMQRSRMSTNSAPAPNSQSAPQAVKPNRESAPIAAETKQLQNSTSLRPRTFNSWQFNSPWE